MNRFFRAAQRLTYLRTSQSLRFALMAAFFAWICVSSAHGQARLVGSPTVPTVTLGSGIDLTYTYLLTETESVYIVQVDPGFTDYTIKDTSGCPIDPTGRTNSAPGTSCVIVVHFQPSVAGLRTAPLRIEATTGSITTPIFGYGDGPQGVVYPGGESVFLGVFGTPGFNGDNFVQYKEVNNPSAIAFDSGSRLYFADQGNYRIRRISTTVGTLETVAGNGTAGFSGDGGPSTSAQIGAAVPGIALDGAQNMFIVDQANFRIREIGTYLDGFTPPTINTIIGSGTQASSTGCATTFVPAGPSFNTLYGIAVDGYENIYFSDAGTGCIYRRQGSGDETGNITLIGGTGTKTSTGDGGLATAATFISPGALALDSQQQYLYVIDMGDYADSNGVHHGKNIRRINLQTGIVTAVAGNGSAFNTSAGDGGLATAANFNNPNGLVLDAANNLYITETQHVRRIDAATGTITTVVGNTAFNGLTQAPEAGMHFQIAPTGIALDTQGSYYLLEPSEAVIQKIDLTAPYLGFNSTYIGSTSIDSPQTFYISNIGTESLNVAGPAPVLSSSNYIVSTNSPVTAYVPCATTIQYPIAYTLAPGTTCASSISFIPSTQDGNNETATFTDNSLNTTGGLAQAMTLVAESYGNPSVGTLLPSPVDFGQVTTSSSATKSITFTNTGNASLTFFSATVTGSSGQASAAFTQTNNCPNSLQVGGSCVFNVVFAPTATGAQSATLTVNSTIVGGNTAALTGTGAAAVITAPQAALSPSAAFGSVQIGSSGSQTLTLTNAGTAALPITSYMITAGATQFAVAGSTCTSSLAAGAACTFTITFTPTATGSQSGAFAVTDSVGTQTASLSGTATAAPAPQAALTPATASFGSLTVGTTSAAQTFQLMNAGNASLPITSVAVSSGSGFTIASNTCTASLAAGASCQIAVTFTPQSAATAAATLTVVDSVGTQTAALSGTGTAAPAPQAALTPASASFGSLTVGTTSAAQTFQLTNPGNAALPITSVSVTSASAFTIASNTCTTSLAAGASCQIGVTFKPSSVGSASATLTVVDSVSTQTSALSGSGTSTVAADFSLTATPATQSSYLGSSVTYTVQLASVSAANPFSSNVTLAVTGLPAGATSSFSPAAVTPGTSGATSNLTVNTPPRLSEQQTPQRPGASGRNTSIAAGLLGLLLLGARRRRLPSLLSLCLVALIGLAAASATGCSSGGTGFAVPTSTSTLVISGNSGSITHSTNVTLTLQ